MKKLMMIAATALLAGSAFAQKPTEGSVTLETQLNFQTGTAPVNFFTPNIRARYFLSEGMAARVQFAYLSKKNKSTYSGLTSSGSEDEGELTQSNSQFTLRPGIEKHFAGTTKLSPYIGAEINLQFAGAKEETDNVAALYDPFDGTFLGFDYAEGTSGEVTGGWNGGSPTYAPGTTIGLNLIAGADFYVWDNLYIGAELGWGFNSFSEKDLESTSTTTLGGVSTTTTSKIAGGKESGFAMVPSGFVRIGWMLK